MATSGTYVWSPDLAECVDEAFERCRVDPSTLTGTHVQSARRSIDFLMVEWSTDDKLDFMIERVTGQALVQGTASYTINPSANNRVLDVLQVSLLRSNVETTLPPMTRQEYDDIPNKTVQGRPSRYFLDRQRDNPVIVLWPTPENSTDTLNYDAFRRMQDTGGAGSFSPDIPYQMRDAFVAGLAARLNRKFGIEQLTGRLDSDAFKAYLQAKGSVKGDSSIQVIPGGSRRRRGGKRGRW